MLTVTYSLTYDRSTISKGVSKMSNSEIRTFPLKVTAPWLEKLGHIVNLSDETSKHDFILKAVEEKMERVEKENTRR